MTNVPLPRTGPASAALAGIGGPLGYAVLTVVGGMLRPGYDPVRQHISDLGVGERGWLQNGATIALGLLIVAFARWLHRGFADPRDARSVYLPLGGCGAGAIVLGFVPVDGATVSVAHVLAHTAAVGLCVLTLLAAALLLAIRLGHDPHWGVWARWSGRYAGLVAVALIATLTIGELLLARWGGLLERVLIFGGLGWLALIALGVSQRPAPRHSAGRGRQTALALSLARAAPAADIRAE